jgi:cytochrome c oxidase subunit IV
VETFDNSVEETERETRPEATSGEPELVHHPGPREYIRVAIILALATAAEVGLYYMNLPHPLLVALLFFFAIVKFSLVALWFMHLRFDARIFRRLFVTGIALALSVYMIVLLTFGVFVR